ncbi:MAG: hypothetical protein R3F04_13190 [Lysobacteraceae bacterium]
MAIETNRSVFYPRLIRRVRAILVDSIILPVVMFGVVMVGSAAGVSDGYAKFALLIVPIFVLEPAMVAVTGGTIGHVYQELHCKVGRAAEYQYFGGDTSFRGKGASWVVLDDFILTTKGIRHFMICSRALSSSINRPPLPAYEILVERNSASGACSYPPAWRRVLVIFGYWILSSVVAVIVSGVAVSNDCLAFQFCAQWENLLLLGLNIAWLVSLGFCDGVGMARAAVWLQTPPALIVVPDWRDLSSPSPQPLSRDGERG